ncbi:MAG: hypothetical protein RLZZ297_1603 [Chloroflexota bacterium]|jgi:DNA topoisomerase-1
MSKYVVIVESPAKAKTIEKYLGSDYIVRASVGHVRDLPKGEGSIDIDNGYKPFYVVSPGKEQVVNDLGKLVKKASVVYMATDPDREGEAIAWHIVDAIDIPKKTPVQRVSFTEITPTAVREAMQHPRSIDMDLVNAQQARRVVDRLMGYGLSRVLWDRVRRGLSGGRVQSVAVRLVVERENEIRAFVKQEFWSILADLRQLMPGAMAFRAKMTEIAGKKMDKFHIGTEAAAGDIVAALQNAQWRVQAVNVRETRRNAPPPFITSTLQQAASSALGMSSKRTMAVAQQLYEGIDIGGSEGSVGLITYMRTDSVNVSKEAQEEARAYIRQKYGAESVPAKPNVYTTKSKSAQEAHEAVRPTLTARAPETLRAHLDRDQYRLYELIWKRFVASQMAPAVFDAQTADIAAGRALPADPTAAGEYTFRATGLVLKFAGHLILRMDAEAESEGDDDEEKNSKLPALQVAEALGLDALKPTQHFTEPPPRYKDATLIKELERLGIGRPSTYATITSTIVERKYVEIIKGNYVPTALGETVNTIFVKDFELIVDYPYTSRLEDRLDLIAEGEQQWVAVVDEYYKAFLAALEKAKRDRVDTSIGMACPSCEEGQLVIKFGRDSEFVGCSRFPDCTFTTDFKRSSEGQIELTAATNLPFEGVECPVCKGPMIKRKGRFGEFLACMGYPACRGTQRLDKNGRPVPPPEPTGVTCPKCSSRELLKRKGSFGRPFYGCAGYPDCDYIVNDLDEVASYDPAVEAAKTPSRRTIAARASAERNAKKPAAKTTTRRTATASKTTKPAAKSTAKPAAKGAAKAAPKGTAKPAPKAATKSVTTAAGTATSKTAATAKTGATKGAAKAAPKGTAQAAPKAAAKSASKSSATAKRTTAKRRTASSDSAE